MAAIVAPPWHDVGWRPDGTRLVRLPCPASCTLAAAAVAAAAAAAAAALAVAWHAPPGTGTEVHAAEELTSPPPVAQVWDETGTMHGLYARYLVPGILLLITFALVIPLFYFLVLWRNRKSLQDPVVAAKYGFLYTGYSERTPYWETTEMVRKVLIALIPVSASRALSAAAAWLCMRSVRL